MCAKQPSAGRVLRAAHTRLDASRRRYLLANLAVVGRRLAAPETAPAKSAGYGKEVEPQCLWVGLTGESANLLDENL